MAKRKQRKQRKHIFKTPDLTELNKAPERKKELKNVERVTTTQYREKEVGMLSIKFDIFSRKGESPKQIIGYSGFGFARNPEIRDKMLKEATRNAIAQYMSETRGAQYANVNLKPKNYGFVYFDDLKARHVNENQSTEDIFTQKEQRAMRTK